MHFIQKITTILFKSSNFFSQIEKEHDIKQSFIYYLTLELFYTVLVTMVLFYFPRAYTIFFPLFPDIGGGGLVKTMAIGFIFAIPTSFAVAGVLYIWLRLFKGKRPYYDAYKLYAYSKTPSFIFGWIPLVNFVVWIYSLVLLIIGTQKMYKFTSLKSTLMYIIPLIVILIVLVIFGFLATLAAILSGTTTAETF